MATRPKQRVLVRWNDDLDKSLLLFITHTCSELGIKIPYDEIARRMGSTFTEGAIQQHISKLRNKMAELNVAPVPAAPRRGTVTNKPSAVYGQKGRAGLAPQQPVASKVQARSTSARNTTTKTRPKRIARGKAAPIKRSESDENQTDDEFGGASDDDFVAEPNTNGKRTRVPAYAQGPAAKKIPDPDPFANSITAKIMRKLAAADEQYFAEKARKEREVRSNQEATFMHNSIEHTEGLDAFTQYGQRMEIGRHEEEEDVNQPGISFNPANQPNTYNVPNSFDMQHDDQLSPTSVTPMPTQLERSVLYNGPQAMYNNYGSDIGQVPQPLTTSQNGATASYNTDSNFNYYSVSAQTSNPFQTDFMNAPIPLPAYPPASTMPTQSGYSAALAPMRNDSMISSSSQNTFGNPVTPTLESGGVDSAYHTPYNAWSDAHPSAPDQFAGEWSFDPTAFAADVVYNTNNQRPDEISYEQFPMNDFLDI